ncbi:MAG: carbon-nitrogen hydrolase family protein [Solirubrobacteraceae bacterium]|nr:carbon-nitrogen hydrolase family protein [Solirubrobacteraceae bacterium]
MDDVLETAEKLVERAARGGAELVALPEKWNGVGPPERLLEIAEPLDGPSVTAMRGWAKRLGIMLSGGSISERVVGDHRIRNLALVISTAGEVVARYRKVHMFDVELDGRTVRESDTDAPGDRRVTCDIAGWRVGLTICYDLRFPELYRALASDGADLFTVPSGFMLHTGRDHWEVLLRARAIENGAYVMAANQHGLWGENRMLGRSMIVDPWGIVVANAGDGDGVCFADLDPRRVGQARQQIPALVHRRPHVYAARPTKSDRAESRE